jgi:hypothetical protein
MLGSPASREVDHPLMSPPQEKNRNDGHASEEEEVEEEEHSSSLIKPELPPPKWYDSHVMLGVEEDQYYLSSLQCILRSEFIEAFGCTQVRFCMGWILLLVSLVCSIVSTADLFMIIVIVLVLLLFMILC